MEGSRTGRGADETDAVGSQGAPSFSHLSAEESQRLRECVAYMRRCSRGAKYLDLDGVDAELEKAGAGEGFWRNIHYGEEGRRGLPVYEDVHGTAEKPYHLVLGQRFRVERKETINGVVWLHLQEGGCVMAEDPKTVYCIKLDQFRDFQGRIPEGRYRGQTYPKGMYTEGFGGSQPHVLVSASGDNQWTEINVEMLFRDIPTATVFEGAWGGDATFTTWVAFYALNVGLHGELQSEAPKQFLVTVKNSSRFEEFPMKGPDIEDVKDIIGRAQYKECCWIKEQFDRRHFSWDLVIFLTAFQFLKKYCRWTTDDCKRATEDRAEALLSEDLTFPFEDKYLHQAKMLRWAVAEAFGEHESGIKDACKRIDDGVDGVYAALRAKHSEAGDILLQVRDRELLTRRTHLVEEIRKGNVFHASAFLKQAPDDKEVALETVNKNGSALQYASADLRDDKDVVLCAMRRNPNAMKFASERMKGDPDVKACATASASGSEKKGFHVDKEKLEEEKRRALIADVEANKIQPDDAVKRYPGAPAVVRAAVLKKGLALQHASEELQDDEDIALCAVQQSNHAWKHISDRLQNLDCDTMLTFIQRFGGSALLLGPASLNNDRFVVLAACAQDPKSLCYASDEIRRSVKELFPSGSDGEPLQRYAQAVKLIRKAPGDRSTVLAALAQSPYVLEFASVTLKDDVEVVAAACEKEPKASRYASRRLERLLRGGVPVGLLPEWVRAFEPFRGAPGDRDLLLAAIAQDRRVLGVAPDALRDDVEIVVEACKRDPEASRYASCRLSRLLCGGVPPGLLAEWVRAFEPFRGAPGDRDLMLAAIAQCPRVLSVAPDALKDDMEIVMAAVQRDRSTKRYAPEHLRLLLEQGVPIKRLPEYDQAVRDAPEVLYLSVPSGPNYEEQNAGRYNMWNKLRPGHRVWQQEGGKRFLYHDSTGHWCVATDESSMREEKRCMQTQIPHFCMPHQVRGFWEVWTGKDFALLQGVLANTSDPQPPPHVLHLSAPDDPEHCKQLAGEYQLRSSDWVNGRPVWQRAGGPCILYSETNARWTLSTSSEDTDDSLWIQTREVHMCMPHQVQGDWGIVTDVRYVPLEGSIVISVPKP